MTFALDVPRLGRSLADFCDQLTEEYLDPHEAVELDQLVDDIDEGDGVIGLRHGSSGVRPQSRLEVGEELIYVWGAAAEPNAWMVSRGWQGTTPAAADAGAVVRVNPRWPRQVLARQLVREVQGWPVPVCAVATTHLSGAGDRIDVPTPDDLRVRRVLRVTADDVSVPHRVEQGWGGPLGGHLSLVFESACARDLRVVLGVDFAVEDLAPDDDLGEVGLLSARLVDAAMLGVAGRLLMASELPRTDTSAQPRARMADDVPPGHRLQAGQALLMQRDVLLKAEAESLLSTWGVRG